MQKPIDRPGTASFIDDFLKQVKLNCNISDAKFWGYYSICGLLMRYRELYRNEQAMKPWDTISNEEIICWIHERETLWNELEDLELQDLVIDSRTYSPFDVNGLNAELNHVGLVYGSGYGAFNKPTFFIGRIDATRDLFDYRVHYIGRELCRDIAAAPAMLQGRCIYLRVEVIAQFLWDRFQDMKSNDYCLPTAAMFSHYRIDRATQASPELHERFHHLSDDAAEVFVMHEVGEAYEDEYDDAWHEMLFDGCDKATELFLRGIKDIRADTSSYGPLKGIIASQSLPQLSIFVAFMDGIRKEIFPEIRGAVAHVLEQNEWSVIESARVSGYQRAARLQYEVVRLWRQQHNVAVIAQFVRDAFPRPGQKKN
jgi:hypothetical protein